MTVWNTHLLIHLLIHYTYIYTNSRWWDYFERLYIRSFLFAYLLSKVGVLYIEWWWWKEIWILSGIFRYNIVYKEVVVIVADILYFRYCYIFLEDNWSLFMACDKILIWILVRCCWLQRILLIMSQNFLMKLSYFWSFSNLN